MKSFVLFSAAVGMVLCSANGAFASVISFSTAPTGNIPTYSEAGFTFDRSASGTMNISDFASTPFSSNFLSFQEPATVTLTNTLALPFNLNSYNFAGAIAGNNLTVLGTFSGGGTISQMFTTTGLFESSGTLLGWTDLASVRFSTSSTSAVLGLDNVNVELFSAPAAVPEPATASILGFGTLVGAVCQYRRRKRVAAKK